MLRPKKIIDASVTRARLDDVVAVVRREAEGAEADPFDEAMIAAAVGLAQVMKAEADALVETEGQVGKLARRI